MNRRNKFLKGNFTLRYLNKCSAVRKTNYNKILINQMVALAILDILFVSSAHYNTEGAICKVWC